MSNSISRWSIATLGIGAVGMATAAALDVPGGPFTGAIVFTATARLLGAPLREAPDWLKTISRVLLGLSVGISVTPETVRVIGRALPVVLATILGLIGLGLAIARAVNRITGMPLPTALCGSTPGGLAVMVALSEELEGDAPVVASMQLFRLVSVVLVVPALVRAFLTPVGSAQATAAAAGAAAWPWGQIALLVVGAAVLAVLALKVRVPAGDMIAGIIVAGVVNALWLDLPGLPGWFRYSAQLVIGAGVGASVTREAVRTYRPYAWAGAMSTVLLIASGLGLGWLVSAASGLLSGPAGGIDLVTAIVGIAPGGADTMMILAGELGADAQLVAAMHVARLIIIMVMLPAIIRLAAGRSRNTVEIPVAVTAGSSCEMAEGLVSERREHQGALSLDCVDQ